MTERRSMRARARRIYVETMTEQAYATAAAPSPDLSPHGGGERAVRDAITIDLPLMARVRRLYEGSAVPVAEIARLAGVAERTVYKYARQRNWKPRYAWMPDGSRPPARAAARRRWTDIRQIERAQRFAPVKGAGGRFVARADKGKPHPRGLKATDPAGAAAANAACARAARLAAKAELEAEIGLADKAMDHALRTVNQILRTLAEYREECAKKRAPHAPPPATPDHHEQLLLNALGGATGFLTDARLENIRLRAQRDREFP